LNSNRTDLSGKASSPETRERKQEREKKKKKKRRRVFDNRLHFIFSRNEEKIEPRGKQNPRKK
jgi:hypothetical protein